MASGDPVAVSMGTRQIKVDICVWEDSEYSALNCTGIADSLGAIRSSRTRSLKLSNLRRVYLHPASITVPRAKRPDATLKSRLECCFRSLGSRYCAARLSDRPR